MIYVHDLQYLYDTDSSALEETGRIYPIYNPTVNPVPIQNNLTNA